MNTFKKTVMDRCQQEGLHQISNVSTSSQTIHKYTRVGQLVTTPIVIADFVLVLGEERGTGTFGSTGE